MRLQKALPVVLLIAGLTSAVVWCVGPCCPSMGAGTSALSIGAISCCGTATPSRCQPSVQRTDTATVSSTSVTLAPPELFASPARVFDAPMAADSPNPRACLSVPRLAFPALHTPLLI